MRFRDTWPGWSTGWCAPATCIVCIPGVYAVGHARLTAKGRWMAGVLACGDGALLSHHTAAALHDLRSIPSGDIHVIAAGQRRLSGIHAHTHRVESSKRMVIDAIPATSVERTIGDLAPSLAPQRLRTMIEQAMRLQTIDFARLEPRHGRPGAPALEYVLAQLSDAAPRTHAGLETDGWAFHSDRAAFERDRRRDAALTSAGWR